MRSAGNFSPEWGYLAPTPSFARTARVVLVATAIGATAGAGVVFALIERPAEPEKTPRAARAIVTSVRTTAVPAAAPAASATPVTAAVAAPVPAASASASAPPTQQKLQPVRPETQPELRQAAIVAMPPTPPIPPQLSSPASVPQPIAANGPVTPAVSAAPVLRTRSIAAHAPGNPVGSPAIPVLRTRSVAANAPVAPAPAQTNRAPATVSTSTVPPTAPPAPATLASASSATPNPTAVPSANSNIADPPSGPPTAQPSAAPGEAAAVAPAAPTDTNGNPSIIAPETTAPKKSKHNASGKNNHYPGIGTMLRRFFVAHSGRTYYPNRGGLSN